MPAINWQLITLTLTLRCTVLRSAPWVRHINAAIITSFALGFVDTQLYTCTHGSCKRHRWRYLEFMDFSLDEDKTDVRNFTVIIFYVAVTSRVIITAGAFFVVVI